MISSASALAVAAVLYNACPAIDFSELRPEPGAEFIYAFWRDRQKQPGLYRIEIPQSSASDFRVDVSFFLINNEWTDRRNSRVIGGVFLASEEEFNGISPRQLSVRAIDPPVHERNLAQGEEFRIPVIQTVTTDSDETLRHEGSFVFSHAGCGEMAHEGEIIQTRKIRVNYQRYVGGGPREWQLQDVTQIYQIPVGANWFYAQHREANHPMQQGTVMQGFTVP